MKSKKGITLTEEELLRIEFDKDNLSKTTIYHNLIKEFNSNNDYHVTMKQKRAKNKSIIIALLIVISLVCMGVGIFLVIDENDYLKPIIEDIELLNYDKEDKEFSISIKTNKYGKNTKCLITNNSEKYQNIVDVINNECLIVLKKSNYTISLIKNNKVESDFYILSDYIRNNYNINLNKETIYLIKDEEEKVSYSIDSITDKEVNVTYSSNDINIATVTNDGKIKGVGNGKTQIVISDQEGNSDTVNVIVTTLLNKATLNNSKSFLPCKRYSSNEAKLLDQILEYKIAKKGLRTRAGVVEAARFLTLNFPYRLGYFLENGRLATFGYRAYADGEGRFYHKGLYLSTDKYALLEKIVAGPAIWGCSLKELSFDDDRYRANGLDCSGFISWCLKNGGYDFKDMGSGPSPGHADLSTIGIPQSITVDLLKSGKVKAGDLIGTPGHIAIIIGIDDTYIYVAEELTYTNGLYVKQFTFSKLAEKHEFDYIYDMEKAYENNGDYTRMW